MAEKQRLPFIMEVRDLWPAIFVELGVLRNPTMIHWLEKWELSLYRRADRIVTLTEAFRRKLIERDVPSEKVHTILNGADIDFWQPGAQAPSTYHDQCARARNIFILRCGTKDYVLFVPQSRQRVNSGRSPCRRIASENRGA
jgi:glycosyltransferase involved in cell wall biosynthesis